VLADRAVYPLMLALIAMGPVVRSEARVERDGSGTDVAAAFALDHAGGGRSELAVSLRERLDNDLRIEGETGAVEVPPPLLSAQRLRFGDPDRRPPDWWRAARQNPLVRRIGDLAARFTDGWHPYDGSPYRHEVDHFADLVRRGIAESPVISHRRMLDVVALIDEARGS
jgi:predicted dehydrogenase